MTSKRTASLIGTVIFVIVVAVFSVNFGNSFVRFDDYQYIVKNKWIARGLTPRSVLWSFCAVGYASNWHPLAWMSHAADISAANLFDFEWREEENDKGLVAKPDGALARLVHAENVVLHAVNAVLLWVLMMAFVAGRSDEAVPSPLIAVVAAGCALLWALHPLRVEVVAWAAERKELLSVMFMLLTLIFWVKGDRNGTHGVLALFCFALALLAKPVAVSLPAVLFAWDWAMERRGFRESLCRIVPFAFLSAAVCVLTMGSQTTALEEGGDWDWSLRILCAVEAPIVYLRQTVWPFGLCLDYAIPDWSSWPWFAAGCALLVGGVAGMIVHVRHKGGREFVSLFPLLVAWCYISLIPMIGIVKVGYEPHSDRYTYWIGCGLSFCLCAVVVRFVGLWKARSRELAIGAGVILVALATLSNVRSKVWKDSSTLFADVVSNTHNEFFANMLAEVWGRRGGEWAVRAEEMLRDTLQIKHSTAARAALALHLAIFGEGRKPVSFGGGETSAFMEARMLAGFALEEGTRSDWAYAALGFADYREGRFRSAYENMKKALDLGYEGMGIVVNLDEWRKKAEESPKEDPDVQR